MSPRARSIIEAFNNDDWDASKGPFGGSTYNEVWTQRSLAGADAIIGWKAAIL